MVKREREVIHIGQPNMGRPPGVEVSKFKELESKLSAAQAKIESLNKEVATLTAELDKHRSNKNEAEKNQNLWKTKYEE